MPCNGGQYFDRSRERYDDQKKIDSLTRLLCHACGLLSASSVDMGQELDEWWYEHRLKDEELKAEAKRRAEAEAATVRREAYLESIRKRVMRQLTDDELEALGIT